MCQLFLFQFLSCLQHEDDSDDDEWYGEQLSHVECHGVFEEFLVFFRQFDEKSECENVCEA